MICEFTKYQLIRPNELTEGPRSLASLPLPSPVLLSLANLSLLVELSRIITFVLIGLLCDSLVMATEADGGVDSEVGLPGDFPYQCMVPIANF